MKTGRRKVSEKSMANITAPTSVPDVNTLSRKSEMLTTGTRAVSSRIVNVARATTAIAVHALIVFDSNQSSR